MIIDKVSLDGNDLCDRLSKSLLVCDGPCRRECAYLSLIPRRQ